MIYLDNASTSFPKPKQVLKGIEHYFTHIGINPYRTNGRLGARAEQIVHDTRVLLAEMLNIDHPNHICFTQNATHSLNLLIKGILKEGDHVIISNFEHNSVLRPLQKLKQEKGITWDVIESNPDGFFDLSILENKIQPKTRLIIWSHASNVLGVISPILEIGKLAKKHRVHFLVDCAQTAGIIDLDVKKSNIDFLAGTAHKSLLGPPGVGFFYAKDCSLVETLIEGSGGHHSTSPFQPNEMPYKFETGTLNYLGIAGFFYALKYLKKNQSRIHEREYSLLDDFMLEMQKIKGVILYGTSKARLKVPVVSFNVKGISAQHLSYLLENDFSILTRSGLHCSPNIHKTLNTFPTGTVRVSFGYKNSKKDLGQLLKALREICSCIYK